MYVTTLCVKFPLQGIPGQDGPQGPPGIPGCNGTKAKIKILSLCYFERKIGCVNLEYLSRIYVFYHFKFKLRVDIEESVLILQGDRGRDGIPGIPGLLGPPVRKRQLIFHTSSSFSDCLALDCLASVMICKCNFYQHHCIWLFN